jgi:putative acetyltransferase
MIHTYILEDKKMPIDRITSIRNSTRAIVQYLGYMDNQFATIGSISQCYALLALEKRNLTSQELSSALSLETSTVSRLTKDLVDKGYCAYLPNDQDRRSHYIHLTKLGKKKLSEIHSLATQQVQAALEALTPKEQAIVAQGLSLYALALRKNSTGEPQ